MNDFIQHKSIHTKLVQVPTIETRPGETKILEPSKIELYYYSLKNEKKSINKAAKHKTYHYTHNMKDNVASPNA